MIENQKKHSLGHRAFFLFLSRKLKPVIIFLALVGLVWYIERWFSPEYDQWLQYAVYVFLVIAGTIFILMLLRSFLEYRFYTYTFTNEAFIMTYGYIMRNEVAALYHQIQTVHIIRSPLDRLTGVSRVVIIMTGAERDGGGHNRITLPGVSKTKAMLVQQELLTRARRHFQGVV